jgi:type VI secretion system protein ImpL
MPDTSYLRQLQNLSPREMPGPIRSILKDVAGGSSGLVEKETDRGFLYEQHKQVTEPCTLRKIPSLYPFNPGASASVPVGDFAAIFGPDGVIERFRQIPQYAPHLPIEYDYAKIIKEAFFRAGDRPEFSFSIEPVQMDGSITSMNLTIGRQHIRYAHGASQPTTITWPDGDQQVRLSLQPQTPSGTNEINLAGLWALHQLFKKHGHIRPGGSPDVFTVEVGVGGRRATFKVTTTSRLNPFTLPELGKFRCPTGMRH